MSGKIIEIIQDPKRLYLTWIINNICTNSCSYCPPIVHNGKNHYYDWDYAEKFIDALHERYPEINLAISGGEPTVSPWLPDLIKKFRNMGEGGIGMSSNASRTARYYSDIAEYLDYIVLSYHPSFHDDEFTDKVLACSEKTNTTVSVMMDSRYFEKSVEMYERLMAMNISNVETMRIISWFEDNNVGHEYTDEHEESMRTMKRTVPKYSIPLMAKKQFYKLKRGKDFGNGATYLCEDGSTGMVQAQEMINRQNNNFYGWECDIGLESLYVKYDGVIKTANCFSSPTIGRIQELENIKWPSAPVICPQTFCHCTTDVYVSKRDITKISSTTAGQVS
jgi:molybdenum cofactor biosynthesis enzyme MoaA